MVEVPAPSIFAPIPLNAMARSAISGSRAALEMTVRPYSSLHVLDLAAKGTIRNKEVFNRNYFEKLSEVDPDTFAELIDLWVLEYAEQFAATS